MWSWTYLAESHSASKINPPPKKKQFDENLSPVRSPGKKRVKGRGVSAENSPTGAVTNRTSGRGGDICDSGGMAFVEAFQLQQPFPSEDAAMGGGHAASDEAFSYAPPELAEGSTQWS